MSTWVVGAVLVDDSARPTHVLAARRRDVAPSDGGWEFPGGKVEPGETPREALMRELYEELGIDAVIRDEIDEPRCGWEISDELRLRLFVAETHGEPAPGPDHDDVRWVEIGQLASVDWLRVDREALPAVEAAVAGLSSAP